MSIPQSPNLAIEVAVHPAAEMFPLMAEAELQALADDIRQHGQREPVVFYRDQLLDGRNRWLACRLAGVDPDTCEIDESEGFDPLQFVLSVNYHRRHLTAEQRSYIRGKRYLERKGEQGDDRKSNGKSCRLIDAAEKLAKEHDVSPRTIRNDADFARGVDANPDPGDRAKILAGKSGKTKAEVIAAAKPPAAKPSSAGATTDELGATLPGKMRPAFDMRDIFTSILSDLRGIKKRVDALATSAAGVYLSDKELAGELDNVIRALKYGKPYAICPQCKGKG